MGDDNESAVSTTLPSPGKPEVPSTTLKSPKHPSSSGERVPDTIREVPMSLPGVGETIGARYRVEGFIGSGGMAHVLAARHLELGHLVAIKVLDPALAEESEARERFSRESRAMARLRSKYTVRVHDVGLLDTGAPYMVMDHLEGKDLGRLLADSGPLPVADVCLWMEQACEAVEEAHAQGIVHRDLKPQNIFLALADGQQAVRVLDFGIARSFTGGLAKLSSITKAGDIIGTLTYMAPEQIRDSKSVDPRADIWSLGACVYRLVAGVRPFNGAGELGIIESIFSEQPKPLRELREGVPAILDALVARCLAKKPEDRYATVSDLRAVLRSARKSLDEPAVIQRPAQTRTAPLVLPLRPVPPAPPITQPRMDASPSPPGSKIALPMNGRAAFLWIAVAILVIVVTGLLGLWAARSH